jgi:hypothetical protein
MPGDNARSDVGEGDNRPLAPVVAPESKWKDAHSHAIVKSTDALSMLAQILGNDK